MLIFSFVLFTLLSVVFGMVSYFFATKNSTKDYIIGGNKISAWMIGVSASATASSSFMFTALMGYFYMFGLSGIFMLFPWLLGDLAISFVAHKGVRHKVNELSVPTFSRLISTWHGVEYIKLRFIIVIGIVIFLGVYAAAQLNASALAFQEVFNIDIKWGKTLSVAIIIMYCFFGGFRAAVWTDVLQFFIMFIGLVFVLYFGFSYLGSLDAIYDNFLKLPANYLNPFYIQDDVSGFVDLKNGVSSTNTVKVIIFIAGWFFTGVGAIGQPQLVSRFMATRSEKDVAKARFFYYSTYFLFSILCVLISLLVKLILAGEITDSDAEKSLLLLSQKLLPEFLQGLLLAGLFAAVISTVDSQIIACSTAISNDLTKRSGSYFFNKFITIFISLVALGISLLSFNSIFELVSYSWIILGGMFSVIILLNVWGFKLSEKLLITMLVASFISIFVYLYSGFAGDISLIIVMMLVQIIVFAFSKVFGLFLLNTQK